MTPEAKARVNIDKMLADAGYVLQDMSGFNRTAAQGVAVREYPGRRIIFCLSAANRTKNLGR